jgi:hypothetical protein
MLYLNNCNYCETSSGLNDYRHIYPEKSQLLLNEGSSSKMSILPFEGLVNEGIKEVLSELFGLNIRVTVQREGRTTPISVSVNSLAKKCGIVTYKEKHFLKIALKCSESADKTFQQIMQAKQENILEKMASNPQLLDNPEFLVSEESFERSMAACRQGVFISKEHIFGGEGKVLTSLDGTNKVALKVLNTIGTGGYNRVKLAWNISERKFVAIRTALTQGISGAYEKDLERSIRDTNKAISFYKHLKKIALLEELELLEDPGSLFKEDSEESKLETSPRKFRNIAKERVVLRELAADGDLSKNQYLYKKRPKNLVLPLLKQLVLCVRGGVGMGDVKPRNINIHRNVQEEFIPKFSDIDGGICVDLSTKSLSQSWMLLKQKLEGSKYYLETVISNAINNKAMLFSGNKILQNVYRNFKQECENVVKFSTTVGFTFGGSGGSREAFFEESRDSLFNVLSQEIDGDCKPAIKKCVQGIVSRVQNIDIKATGLAIVMTLLNKEKAFIVNKPSQELIRELKKKQRNLSLKKRLSDSSIELIIGMLAGKVASDEVGMLRVQRVIEEMSGF